MFGGSHPRATAGALRLLLRVLRVVAGRRSVDRCSALARRCGLAASIRAALARRGAKMGSRRYAPVHARAVRRISLSRHIHKGMRYRPCRAARRIRYHCARRDVAFGRRIDVARGRFAAVLLPLRCSDMPLNDYKDLLPPSRYLHCHTSWSFPPHNTYRLHPRVCPAHRRQPRAQRPRRGQRIALLISHRVIARRIGRHVRALSFRIQHIK